MGGNLFLPSALSHKTQTICPSDAGGIWNELPCCITTNDGSQGIQEVRHQEGEQIFLHVPAALNTKVLCNRN